MARESRAVILVPQGSLFRDGTAALRRKLIEDRLLRSVVQLPAGLLFGTSITTAVLVIDRAPQSGVVFVDGRSAAWDAKSGDLAPTEVQAIRRIVTGDTLGMAACTVPYDDIAAVDFMLTPDRFLRIERETDEVLVSQENGDTQLDAREVFFNEEQQRALAEIATALTKGAAVNLVGSRGTGKTMLLRLLRERLAGATVVAIGLGTLERGALVGRLRQELSSWQGREGRLVLLLDDWDCAEDVVDEQEVADFQRLLYIVVSRGSGSGVVFVSQRPLAELQADWSREILARSVIGAMNTVILGSPALESALSERHMRAIRDRLAHDLNKTAAERLGSPLWAELTTELDDSQVSGNFRRFSAYLDSGDWERFLRELAARKNWIGDECRALGFDIERDRGQFGTFLVRTNLSPEEFVGDLLRPSDVSSLFPDLNHSREKSATVREAFQQWKAQEDRP
jgi:energy-coupling factor transporter ATP-binding protein EcfA2